MQFTINHFSTIDARPSTPHVHVASYTAGMPPQPRAQLPGSDSTVLTLLMAMIVIVVMVMRHSTRFFRSAIQSILVVRLRENAFDERTLNEDAIIVTLNASVALSMAIMLYSILGSSSTEISSTFLKLVALTGGYIVAQYGLYSLLGYVFTSRNMASQWLSGFSSSQCYLGLALLFPAAAVLFYPGAATALSITAGVLYAIARICFICKGFRIFFDNIFSLLYFILYLCSAEIIPILLVYRKACELCC